MITTIALLAILYFAVRAYLLSHTRVSLKMPDGRKWTIENLSIPLLGYKNPKAIKAEGRFYTFKHVQIINALLKFFHIAWHVPTNGEWQQLVDAVGNNAGMKLKSRAGWRNGGNGSNKYGFCVLPAGYRHDTDFNFYGRFYSAHFWTSSTYYSGIFVYVWGFSCLNACVTRQKSAFLYDGISVRLIKNA